jgi:hypothetical protein
VSLTVSASLYIVCDIPLQIGPPIMSFDEVIRVTDARMTVRWGVMEHANELSLPLESCSDDYSISLSPQAIDFLQLVGIHPGYDLLFILIIIVGIR